MILAITIIILAGLIDGILEGYGFDNRKSFERKFNVLPTSYFGSQSWKRAYINNNPDLGFKSGFVRWMGAIDFYHHADDARKIFYTLGGMLFISYSTLGLWLLLLIAIVISGIAKSIGMKWIRS